MKTVLSYMDEHFGKRIILGVVFAFLFAYGGRTIFDVYYKYMDTRQYIEITQPISIDKKTYKPCESMTLTTKLTAEIDVNVKSLTQLVLVKVDGSVQRIGKVLEGEVPIMKRSQHVVSGSIPLPCTLEDGTYYWQGTASYMVFGNLKSLSFISDTFNVYQKGISPQGEDAIKDQIKKEATASGNVVR